ncbi:MAG: lipopolysaccharide biosynthesis protein [Methanococcaceae archaeon]
MIKRFFKDSLIYSLSPLLTRGIQIIMLPVYTRLLTKTEYGMYDILLIVQSFVNVTIAMEITQGFARYYSDASSHEERVLYSSTSFWFVMIMYIAFLILSFILSVPLSYLILGKEYPVEIFQISIISAFGSGIFIYLQNQLRFYLKSKLFAVTSIVFTIVSASSTIILLLLFHAGIMGVFMGLIAGYAVSIFFSWYFSRSNYRLVFDWQKCREMLSFSVPLIPASIGTIILLYIDRIAIRNLMSFEYVAVFGRAYSFASMINIVLVGFQTALLPLIYQNYRSAETPRHIAKIFRYFTAAATSFIMALSIFSIEALKVFTTPAYFGASNVIPVLSFATLFLSMQIFAPGLQIAKKTGIIAMINISAAVLNTSLCFILIPVYGIMGAGIATLITSLAVFSTNLFYSQKYFHIPYEWKKIASVFLFAALFSYILHALGDFSSLSLTVKNILKAVLWLGCVLLISEILIGIKELIKLSKELLTAAYKKIRLLFAAQ